MPVFCRDVMNPVLPQKALMRGVNLKIPRTMCQEPFRLDRLGLGRDVALHIEEGARACVVDVYPERGEEDTETLSVSVAPHAEVIIVSIVPPGFRSKARVVQRSTVATGGKIHWWNATYGGSAVHGNLVSEVMGESGESTVDWIFLARGHQHYDLCVQNIFHASHGKGEVTIKGVAIDRAHVECHGAIVIGVGGGGTSTHLTQHVLMLDASAKVHAIPALEIKTNDVKASHSATVTKVSEEDIFYMGSRGLGQKEARRMYIEGFLGEVVSRIPVKALQKEVLGYLGR